MTNGLGNLFIAGTMESNTTIGLSYPTGTSSIDNRCIGTAFEANGGGSPIDVQLTGRRNALLHCDTTSLVTVLSEVNANNCRIFGGDHQQITIGANALDTMVSFVLFDRNVTGGTITDNSTTSLKFNNINASGSSQIQTTLPVAFGGTGDTGTAWTAFTANVASTSGTITTLGTVVARFKQLGKTVWVELDISITTNGTGAGQITALIPTAGIASSGCLVGREVNNTGKGLIGSALQGEDIKDMARGGKREGAGRPKGSTGGVRLPSVRPDIKQELRELAREHTDTALETLVRICKMSDSDAARVSAASALLDRGYGKPGQQVSQQVNLDITDYDRMDEHQLRERIAEQLHALQRLDGGGTEH